MISILRSVFAIAWEKGAGRLILVLWVFMTLAATTSSIGIAVHFETSPDHIGLVFIISLFMGFLLAFAWPNEYDVFDSY